MSFKSLGRSCPICEGGRRDCRENLSTGLIHCRDRDANPGRQWRYIKDDAHGFGMWAWGDGEDRRDSRPTYSPERPIAPTVASWPVEQRDKAYRAIAKATGLYFQHRRDIAKRPHVTDREIDYLVSRGWLFSWPGGQAVDGAGVGLPGVRPDGRLMGQTTWAVSIPDVDDHIAGVQLRNPDGGYYWASTSNGGATPHVNGELPLGVYGAPVDGVGNFAEGYLKAMLCQARYGGLWIGMAGGQWANAPKRLRSVMEANNITQAVLNADGGATANPNIMGAYTKLGDLLNGWDMPLTTRWWGQTEKSHGDVDEIAPEVYHGAKMLDWAEFEQISPHRELSDWEKAQQRRAQRIEADRRAWLATVAAIAGVPDDSDRGAIAAAFHAQHTLSGPSEVGTFPALDYEGLRRLTVLDGAKMTRKTSKALASVVRQCESANLSGVIYAPTRVLARSLAKVLDAYTVDQYQAMPVRPPNPWIVACPESAWKLGSLAPDVVIFDEPNESIPRVQSGILGNRPQQSREVVQYHLAGCRWAVIAQDGIYRPTVATVQRWGNFAPDEIETIRRERAATEMQIILYHGAGGATEAWDGTALSKAPPTDAAFYSWFDGIVQTLKAGQKVIIPCGAEGKARAIHRVLRSQFPGKRGQTIDGKYTPHSVRQTFADNPSGFAESRGLDWLIYSPTFDSGISIEGTWFDAQFEYVRAFEPATNASQRGERYRDAIKGAKLTERHVYIAQRGLPSMPPVDVFTADYWKQLLTNPADTDAINLARQIGGDDLARCLDQDNPDDWLELPQFMAIQSREVYFKTELLTQEWQRNGWAIVPAAVDIAAAGHWQEVFYGVNQGIIEQKSRALAKAKAKESDGDEVAGAIEATKAHKWELTQTLGPDFALLNKPDFMESWVVAGDGSLQAAQVRSLVKIAHTKPELWGKIGQAFALAAIAKAQELGIPDLPCSPRIYETAKLLATAPGLWEIASGATPEWSNKAPIVLAMAEWARHHATALGRITAHAQRIHGLQFTSKTPAVKCAHRLLKMMGIDAQCIGRDGSDGRAWQYRLMSVDDITAKLAKAKTRPHDIRRMLYRESNQTKVAAALAAVIEAKTLAPEWAALKANLLTRYQASRTSVKENLTTEVVDAPQKPTHRWVWMGLSGWIERIEDGATALFRTMAGTIYSLSVDDLEVIV